MKDERKKPRVHTIYDHTKGVLMWLILYLLINLLASNLPDDRWMSYHFLLDTIWTNSKVLLTEYSKPDVMSTFEFTFRPGKQLAVPAIQYRFENINGI